MRGSRAAFCCCGLLGTEHGEAATRGEDAGDQLEVGKNALDEPPAVAAGDLAVVPFVDGPGVFSGGQRRGDDVPALDDAKVVAGEDRRPVG